MGEGELVGFLAVNNEDNYLHLVLALVLLYAGFSKSSTAATPPSMPSGPTMNQSM